MDKYTAQEQAFKRGYEKGYEDGRKSARNMNVISNADHIRAFNDEEMAKLLMRGYDCVLNIPFCKNKPECLDDIDEISEDMCMACMMEWIQKKYDADNEGII